MDTPDSRERIAVHISGRVTGHRRLAKVSRPSSRGGRALTTLLLCRSKAFRNLIARGDLIGSAVLVGIGFALIALAPAKQIASASAA